MQNKEREKAVFNNLATTESYSEAYDEEYIDLYRHLFGSEFFNEDFRILDVGCGTGHHCIRLAKQGFNITGIDISPESIREAKIRADKEGLEIVFSVQDAESMTFKKDSFDICFCGAVLHHFTCLDHISQELFRITKPGGMVCSYDPNCMHLYSFLSHNILNKLLKLHSFYQYFSPNERALCPEDLEKPFRAAGFTGFQFQAVMLHTKKEKFRNFRTLGYFLSSLLPGKLRKGNMLLMTCKKRTEYTP